MAKNLHFEIPSSTATHDIPVDDNTSIKLRRHGNPQGPRLLFSHGNGLAVDLYYPFWSQLVSKYDLFIYDLRNHGQNGVTQQESHNIPTFINDFKLILKFIDHHYGGRPKIGIFHSLSALISLMAPDHGFGAQILFDPPLCRPGGTQEEFDESAQRTAFLTRQRGEHFRTREDFSELLSYLPSFSRVVPGVLELMARTTLSPHPDNGYKLHCPREYEAQVLDYARAFAPLVNWDELPCPTKVIGGDPTLPAPYLPTFDFSHVCNIDYDFLPDSTHLLQLEYPEECLKITEEFLLHNNVL